MCKMHVNTADPTRLATLRGKAISDMRKRLNAAESTVVDYVLAINPATKEVSDGPAINRTIYIYELDAARLESLDDFIRQILERSFAMGNRRSFLTAYVQQSYMRGTSETAARVYRLASQAGESQLTLAQLEIENIVMNPQFQRRVGLVLARTFNSMEKFSGDLSIDLGWVLADGMTRGISPRQIADTIQKRFQVSHSRAFTIARTEINSGLRTAKFDEGKAARDDLGLDVRLLHRSALLPERTRLTHAQRHGGIYTIEEEEAFYATDGNSINCYCSSTEILVKADGTVYDTGLIEKMAKEKAQFVTSGAYAQT